jgi:CRP-like cAMP-binding protein
MLKHPVFELLSAAARDNLFRRSRLVSVKRGTAVLERGETYDHYVLIGNGLFKAEMPAHRDGGELATVALLTENQIAGELIRGEGATYESSMTVSALSDSDIFLVPTRLMIDTLKANPDCVAQLYYETCKQLDRSRRHIARLLGASNEEKVGATLYELSQKTQGEDSSRRADKSVTQKLIAAVLGMSREQVNRICKTLELEGLLRRTDDGYEVESALAPIDPPWPNKA